MAGKRIEIEAGGGINAMAANKSIRFGYGFSMRTKVVALIVVVAAVSAGVRLCCLNSAGAAGDDEWYNIAKALKIICNNGSPGFTIRATLLSYVRALLMIVIHGAASVADPASRNIGLASDFFRNEDSVVLMSRMISVFFGIAGVIAIYFIASRVWGRGAGLYASLTAAFAPLHIYCSRAVQDDCGFALLLSAAFYFIYSLRLSNRRKYYLLSGVFTGLAISVDYSAAALVFFLVFAAKAGARNEAAYCGGDGDAREQKDGSYLFISLVACVMAFVLSSPMVFVGFAQFKADFISQASSYFDFSSFGEHRSSAYYIGLLARQSLWFFALTVFSILLFVFRGTGDERFVLAYPLSYFALVSLSAVKYDRLFLPFIVFACVLAGGAYERLPKLRALLAAVLLLCAAGTIKELTAARDTGGVDKSGVIIGWIDKNVPPESKILVESDVVPMFDLMSEPGPLARIARAEFKRKRNNFNHKITLSFFIDGVRNYSAGSLNNREYDYVIASEQTAEYIRANKDRYGEAAEFFLCLDRVGAPVFKFKDRSKGVITIFIINRPAKFSSGAMYSGVSPP